MNQKLVTYIPLEDLIIEGVEYKRSRYIHTDDIAERLRSGNYVFIIADVGAPLQLIKGNPIFDLWKRIKANIVIDVDAFSLDDYPGGFAFIASEWNSDPDQRVILLEKYH